MKGNILQEMLLIDEPSVFRLYQEMMLIAGYFIAPVFSVALLLEYFGQMNFGDVVKKLLLITIFMGSFYQFHTKAVALSLESASSTLQKISPRNLFVKKWYFTKVKTSERKEWNFIESFAIPNLNDLVATTFFLTAKIFIWLLKLIYSTVYHLTYVFSGITAILYFLGWTSDALKGTVQASLWCLLLPYVLVAILALVGNSIDEKALQGQLVVAQIDTIIWLFGITLLLLISPVITYGMVRGEGIHSFGSKMGTIVTSSGMKAMSLAPSLPSMIGRTTDSLKSSTKSFGGIKDRFQNSFGAKESKIQNADNKSQSFRDSTKDIKNSKSSELFQKAGQNSTFEKLRQNESSRHLLAPKAQISPRLNTNRETIRPTLQKNVATQTQIIKLKENISKQNSQNIRSEKQIIKQTSANKEQKIEKEMRPRRNNDELR